MSSLGDCKPLIKLEGIPLIERIMLASRQADIQEFLVVTGFNGRKLQEHLPGFSRQHSLTMEFIENPSWERPNGLSVLAAEQRLTEPFLLLMADHLFDPAIIRELIRSGIGNDQVKLAVDRRIAGHPLVNPDDVTRVKLDNSYILDIGKGLKDYQAFDTGIFLCTTAIFPALNESCAHGDESLSGGIRRLAHQHQALAYDIGNRFWLDIDDREAFLKARDRVRSQRAEKKRQVVWK